LQHNHKMMKKPIRVLTLGALVVGCHLDKLVSGSGGPHPTSTAPPVALVFMAQPHNAQVGQKINPAVQVSVVDSAGVPVAGAETTTVVIQLGNPGTATLGGSTTAHPTRGVATFANLWIDKAGNGYTLIAHVSGLRDTTSQPFDVTPPPDTTGSITVTTSTTGLDLDLDGYTVTVDGSTSKSIATNSGSAGVTFPGLSVGNHGVVLSGVAANCSVTGGNSQTASVTAGQTAAIAFSVTCTAIPPTTGSLIVTTSTTGADLDPDGYTVTVDGTTSQSIATNNSGGVTFANLSAASHTVALSGVASNCTVSGANPRTVSVAAGGNTTTGFSVTCTALPPTTGDLVVTTTTGGSNLDPDGYTVTVDGSSQAIGTSGSVTFSALPAGTHTVALSGIASNCTVTSANPMTVTVPAGGAGHADFAISCAALPPPQNHPPVVNAGPDQTVLLSLGSVTVNASFTDQDGDGPWTYTIDWGDGSFTNGSTPTQGGISASHSYGLVSTNTVTVTVTDAHGLSGSDQATIHVVLALP
jgi:PKD domain